MDLNALFGKAAKASASGGGNRTPDGKYLWLIKKIIAKDGFKGEAVIIELQALKSRAVPITIGSTEEITNGVKPLPPGASGSVVFNFKKSESAFGNWKAFVLALFGKQESEVSDEECLETMKEAVAKDQPCRGMVIGDETYRVEIQKGERAGKPFTCHGWGSLNTMNTAELIAARRATLDQGEADSLSEMAAEVKQAAPAPGAVPAGPGFVDDFETV